MNATMGFRTEICFHKAEKFLMAETAVSLLQTAIRRFCLSVVLKRNNQQGEPTIKD